MSYTLGKLVHDLLALPKSSPDVLVQIEGEYYLVRPGAAIREVKGDDFVVIPAVKPILGRWAGEGDPIRPTMR